MEEWSKSRLLHHNPFKPRLFIRVDYNNYYWRLKMKKAIPKKVKKKSTNSKNNEKLYAAEEQGILKEPKDSDELKTEMELGEKDEDLDTEEGRVLQVDEDEIEPWEAGFVGGESGIGQLGKDALTGAALLHTDEIIETEIDGKTYRFKNEENANKFLKKMKKKKG